jgi:MSHA pilin protein MshA
MTQTTSTPKTPVRGQQGFTLIEIIAVLVILGILAAVATPKFLNLQEEAKEKAAQGAIAAAQSQLSMAYAKYVLNGTSIDTEASTICQQVAYDNLNATCDGDLNGTVTITACSGDGCAPSSSDINATGTWTSPGSD